MTSGPSAPDLWQQASWPPFWPELSPTLLADTQLYGHHTGEWHSIGRRQGGGRAGIGEIERGGGGGRKGGGTWKKGVGSVGDSRWGGGGRTIGNETGHCFLPHRADILAILVSSASLLPCISPPLTPVTLTPEVTTIHRSCAVLLASLVVVGCQLQQLQASLVQLSKGFPDDLNVGQLCQWMKHLDLDLFGVMRYSSTSGTVFTQTSLSYLF